MVDTIYLVKKDVNKPNSEDNWIMMDVHEYNTFVKTPAAKGRYFADTGAHEDSSTWYVAECEKELAMKWRAELNRHYYLKRLERESGIQTVSMSSLIIGDEEYRGEEIIADPDADVVVEVMQKIDNETLTRALDSLKKGEYEVIYHFYLSDNPISELELGKMLGVSRRTLNYRKNTALKKIKKYF